ncbi:MULTISPECIES: BatD family protein [Thiorhodovibrio]|uniref:BatD family protein n=1 Tax=Thiorhodovibrio TaxID=61593 RepID=UPI001914A3EE|nr:MULTISPECIES: BatD family protein [Thiorhodovibrio]MBK5969076.1 hypothetical protein [Thiorhodovibrio winogradskyi]WPL14729.1 hypothetical protein Thiosp_04584 [Thiorhodovibrio litoralis]
MMARAKKKVLQTSARSLRFGPVTLLLCAWLVWPALASAAVSAMVDRQQVYEGDALTLTIEAEGQGQGIEPELGPLEQDFDILGTGRSSQISIVNGRASSSLQWRITLGPKRLGELTIPAIEVGSEKTRPIQVQVTEVPQGALGGPGDDVFVELELERPDGVASNEPVMVQQQLPVVVRLYSALPLRGGTLTDPRADGAVLERLGPDQRYSANRDGREYQVIERRYSLSPERSGELRIPPVVFEGELTPNAQGRSGSTAGNGNRTSGDPRLDRMFQDFPFGSNFSSDPLSMLQPGQQVRAQSRALTIEVAARPDDFGGGHWLPAEALTVADSWAGQPPALRVGEPVTRTLTLTAKGLAGSQIPDVDMQVPDAVRTYREPTENETRTDGQVVYAVSKQAVTLIPTQPGTLKLPELKVRWWDIQAKSERETVVPALSLQVAPAAGGAAAPPDREAVEATPDFEAQPDRPAVADSGEMTPDSEDRGDTASPGAGSSDIWGGLLGALLALLALAAAGVATMVAFGKRSAAQGGDQSARASAAVTGSAKGAAISPTGRQPRQSALREAVRKAAADNDPKATADALLALARALWPDDPPLNLGMLARRLGGRDQPGVTGAAAAQGAEAAIVELERALYAPPGEDWSGQGFWDQVRVALGQTDARATDAEAELPPLYPDRS